jgi:hypothetical protein
MPEQSIALLANICGTLILGANYAFGKSRMSKLGTEEGGLQSSESIAL